MAKTKADKRVEDDTKIETKTEKSALVSKPNGKASRPNGDALGGDSDMGKRVASSASLREQSRLAQTKTSQTKASSAAATKAASPSTIPTLAHTLGEMVWLLTRSPLHRNLKIGDLEWYLMAPVLLNQFRLFRANDQVIGLALWAYLTPVQAAEMGKTGKLPAEQWRHGTDVKQFIQDQQAGKNPKLAEPTLKDGDVELWLVDLIVPFATPENNLAQACMADLMKGPLSGKTLKMHKTDPKTGEKTMIQLGGE